jgi:cyanophycin synthetase
LTQGSLIQFGWGSKQRRIQAAETDDTSAIAEAIAQDKDLTKSLLRAAGVPTPLGRVVDSAEQAWQAACDIGLPVVVKPLDSNQGKGVAVNLSRKEQLLDAYAVAAGYSEQVIVERYLPGQDYRLLVVGDRLVAAARREPPSVTGDGVHTVRSLVEKINLDPRRGDGHATSLTRIRLDAVAQAHLASQGYRLDDVPPKGQRIVLRNNANLSTGGIATDVTDDVHPEVAARAVEAARAIGVDICGVDVVCDSVLQPLEEQGGGVVEVNAAPGLRMHLQPSFGKGRDVGKAVIDHMFGRREDARIPVVAVAGANGKTTTVRLIAHCLATHGWRVGMTTTEGVYVHNERIDTGDCSGPRSARNVLAHPEVDAAVLETARGGILREGLAFDRCQVAVVTNIGAGDHLGLNYITTVEDLAVVKRVIVDNVAKNGFAVLNAADPHVAAMASSCAGQIIFFARHRDHPVMAANDARGQRVVYVEGTSIVAAHGSFRHSVPLSHIPLTNNGQIGFQVENAMAALAAAWALNLEWPVIEDALATFVSDPETAPARFNVFDWQGCTLIADYGHNPDAIRALVQAIDTLPAARRSVVISGAGDRRDEDLRAQTAILGQAFDEVILYQDQCQRGRPDGEVLRLLREGLAGAPRTNRIREVNGELRAIDEAMAHLRPGDLCLILVDQVDAALAHLKHRIATTDIGVTA